MSPVVKLYMVLCKRGLYLAVLLLMACGGTEKAPLENSEVPAAVDPMSQEQMPATVDSVLPGETPSTLEAEISRADITAVVVSGAAGAYTFSVTISSPDTGCDQYADWWEVLDAEGQLLYRRVLLHSHVGEQPFARSGGPVSVGAVQIVWVRAHMNSRGYGGVAFRGSVQDGFVAAELVADFSAEVVEQEPLPFGCDF